MKQLSYTTKIFDERDYWPRLRADVNSAQGALLVHVPYISDQGVEYWLPLIKSAVQRGVAVTVVLQRPRALPGMRSSYKSKNLDLLINLLESAGAHVELRDRIHAKFVLIDEHILWEGSLNFLSHFDTREHVRRSISRLEVKEVRDRHELNSCPSYTVGSLDETSIRHLLVQRRLQTGLSQSKLAKLANLKPPDLSRLETGQSKLIPKAFANLLECLDLQLVVVPSYLCGPVNDLIKKASQE